MAHRRVPVNVSGSIIKVQLGKGMTDRQVIAALEPHAHASVLEINDSTGAFCGFEDATTDAVYKYESARLLSYTRTPFCMMEGSNNAPLFSQCCSPRKAGDKFFPCISGFDSPPPVPACSS